MHCIALDGQSDTMHTKWRLQLLAILLHPSNWKDKWRVSICPEVVALGVSIKVKTETMAFHFGNTQYTI